MSPGLSSTPNLKDEGGKTPVTQDDNLWASVWEHKDRDFYNAETTLLGNFRQPHPNVLYDLKRVAI